MAIPRFVGNRSTLNRSPRSRVFLFLQSNWSKSASPAALLHRHALGQVARLVHVAALALRYVVGQKLQGDAREHAAELLAGAGHPDDGVGHGGDGVVALGGHHGHAGAAGMCSTRNRSTSWAVKDLITNARTL